MFSESPVDDGYARSACAIALGEGAAWQQWDATHLKITGADGVIIGHYGIGHTLRLRPAFDLVNLDAAPAGERQVVDDGGSLHAGQGLDLFKRLLIEIRQRVIRMLRP